MNLKLLDLVGRGRNGFLEIMVESATRDGGGSENPYSDISSESAFNADFTTTYLSIHKLHEMSRSHLPIGYHQVTNTSHWMILSNYFIIPSLTMEVVAYCYPHCYPRRMLQASRP